MSKSPRCENGNCEFIPSVISRESSFKRSEDEVRYGRLWAEIDLPKLLVYKELNRERNTLW